MRIFFLTIVFLFGCRKEEYTLDKPRTVNLYPGYLVKAQGEILWFPSPPLYDHESAKWLGRNPILVSSCIADPWPYTEGDQKSIMRVE